MIKIVSNLLPLFALIISGYVSGEPLYWKATKGDKELMILGSIHMGKKEMYPLPEPITKYLFSSDAVILEADLESGSTDMPKIRELTSDYLTGSRQEQLRNISSELGIDSDFLLNQPTWKTALVLQLAYFHSLGYTDKWGVDNFIANQARSKGKPVKGLETVGFQLSLFADSTQVGRDLLNDIIDEWEKNKLVSQCLLIDWAAGDKSKLESLVLETSVNEEIATKFIYQRNRVWADKLDSSEFVRDDGKYLVVVGALHLVGQESLISLLTYRGFDVVQLSQSSESTCQ